MWNVGYYHLNFFPINFVYKKVFHLVLQRKYYLSNVVIVQVQKS
jgi:hypothetical protein